MIGYGKAAPRAAFLLAQTMGVSCCADWFAGSDRPASSGRGVSAGAMIPAQNSTLSPGKPDSLKVGTENNFTLRLSDGTAIGTTR